MVFTKENDTYAPTKKHADEIIFENIEICNKLNIEVEDKHQTLPIIYWIPKLHKKPIGARFIIASKYSCNKPLSKITSNIFRMIYKQVKNFHDKSKFYNNMNMFWVINNSQPVIEKLNKLKNSHNAKSITTYDFKTLYTMIKHDDLIIQLNEIIDLVFKGGEKKYISVNEKYAY